LLQRLIDGWSSPAPEAAEPMTLILSNDDVEKLLTMRECIGVMQEAYVELAEGRGVSRTRSDCFTPTVRTDALYSLKSMDGVAPKLGVGAVRINSDIITWPKRGNNMRREKVPAAPNNRYVGLVLLFSVENGEPLAILPDGVMQRMRVGAANGLGIKYLARADSKTVGILGSGWQAGAQLMAACAVRDIETIRCFSPNAENRAAFAAAMRALLGIDVHAVSQPEDAIQGADIVMCATNSIDHIFVERWIEPGMHVSSIKRPEIEARAIKRADRVVIHWNDPKPIHVAAEGVVIEEKVEGRGWQLAEDIDFEKLPTLPELVSGRVEGRRSNDDVTCFINNVGLGYQFAAAGSLVYRKARASGLGHEVPTDWFTEDVHP
jgi:ornithine cyclodeaminase/alanine dehydrogenase-like protein (mu-crystallin family)